MAKKVAWTDQARADIRAIDRENALDRLHGFARFLGTEEGDVRRLQDVDAPEFRSSWRLRRPVPLQRRHDRDLALTPHVEGLAVARPGGRGLVHGCEASQGRVPMNENLPSSAQARR
jgi:hypothetical protein